MSSKSGIKEKINKGKKSKNNVILVNDGNIIQQINSGGVINTFGDDLVTKTFDETEITTDGTKKIFRGDEIIINGKEVKSFQKRKVNKTKKSEGIKKNNQNKNKELLNNQNKTKELLGKILEEISK
jgi:hypothetical protein